MTPVAPGLIAGTMLVARTGHAGKGLWIFNGGAEYAITNGAVVEAVAILGPGALSADEAAGVRLAGIGAGVARRCSLPLSAQAASLPRERETSTT